MANLYRVPTQNNQQYTLDAQLAAGGTTLTLDQDASSIIQAPGVIVIDRVNSSGEKTASKREYITFTGVSGANLTGLNRGLAGSTDQVHSVGAIVEFVSDVIQEEAWYDVFTQEHTTTGQHASLASVTHLRTQDLLQLSGASMTIVDVKTKLSASGASLVGFPIRPVWMIAGIQSAASTGVGRAITMPIAGQFDHINVTVGRTQAVSAASLLIDVNLNGTSIFEAGTRPAILGSGTFVSTASLLTKSFNAGDVLDVDVDNVGNKLDLTVVGNAR